MASEFTAIFQAVETAITAFAATETGETLLAGRTVKVQNEYAPTATSFPYVTVCEKSDTFQPKGHELDNYETFSSNMIEVNVYDDVENRVELVYALKDVINTAIISFTPSNSPFRFKRISSAPLPNVADTSIYRWLSRYTNDN